MVEEVVCFGQVLSNEEEVGDGVFWHLAGFGSFLAVGFAADNAKVAFGVGASFAQGAFVVNFAGISDF